MSERKYKKEKQLAGVLVICGYVHLMIPGTTMEERYRVYMNPTLTKIYKTKGQRGLDREIIRMVLCGTVLTGQDPSIRKYREFFSLDVVRATIRRYKNRIPEIENEVEGLIRSGCMSLEEKTSLMSELLGRVELMKNIDVLALADRYLDLIGLGEEKRCA